MGEDRRPFLNLTFSTWDTELFISAQMRKQCSADKEHRITSRNVLFRSSSRAGCENGEALHRVISSSSLLKLQAVSWTCSLSEVHTRQVFLECPEAVLVAMWKQIRNKTEMGAVCWSG